MVGFSGPQIGLGALGEPSTALPRRFSLSSIPVALFHLGLYIHSPGIYLLSNCHVLNTVLRARSTSEKRNRQNLYTELTVKIIKE